MELFTDTSEYKYVVIYDAHEGTPYADGDYNEVIDVMVSKGSGEIKSSTENIINEFRCRIAEDKLNCKEVVFVHLDSEHMTENVFEANEHGRFDYWPFGFCDTWDKHLDRLIKLDE